MDSWVSLDVIDGVNPSSGVIEKVCSQPLAGEGSLFEYDKVSYLGKVIIVNNRETFCKCGHKLFKHYVEGNCMLEDCKCNWVSLQVGLFLEEGQEVSSSVYAVDSPDWDI
jgi:hypothetical protein